jgi:hypothetical protein
MVETLKSMKIWSIFKYKPDKSKMPCWFDTGRWGLDWKNPDNLVTYSEAIRARQVHNAAGVGIVIPSGYFAIDLDEVISPDGVIDKRAAGLVALIDSYTERSPSKTGLHILVKADIASAKNIRVDSGSGLLIEVKAPGTYLTYTGDVFHDAEIRDRTEVIKATYDKYLEDHPAKEPIPSDGVVVVPGSYHKCAYGAKALQDECTRIRATPKGSRTHTLYGRAAAIGELIQEGHISESEAARELIAAGVASGLGKSKAEAEVHKGLQAGKSNPRHIVCRQRAPRLRLDLSGISRK